MRGIEGTFNNRIGRIKSQGDKTKYRSVCKCGATTVSREALYYYVHMGTLYCYVHTMYGNTVLLCTYGMTVLLCTYGMTLPLCIHCMGSLYIMDQKGPKCNINAL